MFKKELEDYKSEISKSKEIEESVDLLLSESFSSYNFSSACASGCPTDCDYGCMTGCKTGCKQAGKR